MKRQQDKKAGKAQPARDAAQTRRRELQLLRSLASEDAYATQSSLGETALDVFSRRNGVSLRTGSGSIVDAETLVAQGLAQWTTGQASGRRRLVISEAGQAFLKRADTEEGVDPFFAQHMLPTHKEVEAQGATRRVVFDEAESPLSWLATRRNAKGERLLDPALFEAGERLRRDLTFAQMIPRTTANWDPSLGGRDGYNAPLTYSETVIAARQRADQALRAVGPEFSCLLLDICGFLKGLETIETERQWPRRSAKLVLDLALSALARHYGIETHAEGPSRAAVRHWGAEDYRPKIA